MRRTGFVVALLLSASVLAAKPKVVVDAEGPMKALLTKTLKKKFTPVAPKNPVPDEPGASAIKTACREAGAVAVVTARFSGGVWQIMALNGADGSPLEQFKFSPGKKLKALPKGADKRLEAALADAKAPGAKDEPKKVEPTKDEPTKDNPPPEEPPKKLSKKEQAKRDAEAKKEAEAKAAAEEQARKDAEAQKKKDAEAAEAARVETPVEPPPPPSADQSPALNLGVGFRMFSRRFYYVDDIFSQLSKYSLPIGPAIQVEADWYPAAHFTRGAASRVGINLGFNYALGITSVSATNVRYSTQMLRFRAGLMGRLSLGPIDVMPTAGIAIQNFNIASGAMGMQKPNIPDVRYTNLRVGFNTRITLIRELTSSVGPFAIVGGFCYQHPLSTGEIGTAAYFPRSSATGMDANLGLALGLLNKVEVRLTGEYIRYGFKMNPEVGDKYIAGGALDDSFAGAITVALTL